MKIYINKKNNKLNPNAKEYKQNENILNINNNNKSTFFNFGQINQFQYQQNYQYPYYLDWPKFKLLFTKYFKYYSF